MYFTQRCALGKAGVPEGRLGALFVAVECLCASIIKNNSIKQAPYICLIIVI